MGGKAKRTQHELHASAIRGVGLRVTQPRIAVLRVLTKAERPISHADVIDALDGQGFDRVTLYRNLNDLAEAGIVARTDVGDRVWRFELRSETETHAGNHPHFTCTDCGSVSCLPESAVRLASSARLPKAVRQQSVQVSLRGLCDRCS
ncbi:MAG TPA: transcriptional repressor [Polyangiales bacterium]|nr:transcriptional repressor [Polyangiales bacterium]